MFFLHFHFVSLFLSVLFPIFWWWGTRGGVGVKEGKEERGINQISTICLFQEELSIQMHEDLYMNMHPFLFIYLFIF